MAVEESIFAAVRCSICPSSLPVNTPPKAIGWKHLEGSFKLVLTAVSSKMRVQVKQGDKVIINMQLNKLTPAQKKVVTAPRIQYSDCRMSFRYPSSFQVENGMSERFQMTLDYHSTVLAVVKKLTPFFTIIAPAPSATQSQAPGPSSDTKATNKRKSVGDVEESQVSSSQAPRKKKADPVIPVPPPPATQPTAPPEPGQSEQESSTGSSTGSAPVEARTASREAMTPSGTPPNTPERRSKSGSPAAGPPTKLASPDSADPDVEALKAQLLRGSYTPEATQQSQTPPERPTKGCSAPAQKAPLLDRPSPFRATSPPIPPAQSISPDSTHTTSIDRVEVEIDLLPRSPLVDTATPPFPLPTHTRSRTLGAFASLMGIDFRLDETEADNLNCAFPPMRTAEEEAAERHRKAMDDAEWKDEEAGIESDVSAELQVIWRGQDRPIDLATINDWASGAEVSDDEIFDLLDRGELHQGFLEICYRVAMAAYSQDPTSIIGQLLDLPSSPPATSSYERPASPHYQPSQIDQYTSSPDTAAFPLAITPNSTNLQYDHYQLFDSQHDNAYTPRRLPTAEPIAQDQYQISPRSSYTQDDYFYRQDEYGQQFGYPHTQDYLSSSRPRNVVQPYTRVDSTFASSQTYDDIDD